MFQWQWSSNSVHVHGVNVYNVIVMVVHVQSWQYVLVHSCISSQIVFMHPTMPVHQCGLAITSGTPRGTTMQSRAMHMHVHRVREKYRWRALAWRVSLVSMQSLRTARMHRKLDIW